MDYQAALKYILGFTDFERAPVVAYSAANFDLRRMEELLGRLGNPHQRARSIQVAGTKGKGSTAAMITSALGAAGHRTGFYISPHLHTFRERISIDGQKITEEEFCATVERLKPEVDEVNIRRSYGELTTFEVLTAMAFTHFGGKEANFQVLEVGLGGRLDATNVVNAEICVITSISLDHAEILGHSLAEIAGEKAGIIKPGATVVASCQQREAEEVDVIINVREPDRILRVNSLTAKVLRCIDGARTLEAIAQVIADRFDLTLPQALERCRGVLKLYRTLLDTV